MAVYKEPGPIRSDPRGHSAGKYTPAERERLVEPYLPEPRFAQDRRSGGRKQKAKPIRSFLKSTLHYLVYFLIQLFFSIYMRIRQSYHAVVDRVRAILYYHHRTPELIRKDVRDLDRLPEHLSALLTLRKSDEALEILMDEVAELTAWSTCVGIPTLSIYEKTGILKSYIPTLHKFITAKLATYYGPASHQPTLHLFAPHHPLYTPPQPSSTAPKTNPDTITVLLLSASDGRDTLVDLTKTLSEMAQHGKLSPQDISTKLIDAEITDMITTPTSPPPESSSVSENGSETGAQLRNRLTPNSNSNSSSGPMLKAEPELLLVFGPSLKLDGYPPWLIRLTEIFCTGDKSSSIMGDGEAVEYQRFLQGLWRYARAEMRFGR